MASEYPVASLCGWADSRVAHSSGQPASVWDFRGGVLAGKDVPELLMELPGPL